jgi:hypothetical protein
LINHEEFKTNRIHENLQETENIPYDKDESNIIGFTNSVITVTGVTTKNIQNLLITTKLVIYIAICIVFMKVKIFGQVKIV